MNLFFRELKSYRVGLLFWCVGAVSLIGSGMAKYATFTSTDQSMKEIMDQLPKSLQAVFGMTGLDISTVSGYFGVLFIYIALMATIHAVLLGSGIISKEERDRTSEFLFVKPISRFSAVSSKIMAGLFNVIVLNLVTLVSSIYIVKYFNKGLSATNDIILLMLGLAFMQLIFFFIGTAVAAMVKKPKQSSSIVTSILLSTFMISILININEKLDYLKYLTPFKYFEAKDLLASGSLDILYVLISLFLITAMTLVTYKAFDDRDLSV